MALAMGPDSSTSSGITTGAVPSPRIAASSNSSLDSGTDEMTAARPVADPSVIVGMACRFPGATNTSQLWEVLAEKRDLQKKIPRDRFNVDAFHHPQGINKGTTSAKYGYFLDQGLDQFDNEFFRISGKEAESMDPQQRLLLEVVYEALENAGITLAEISGTQTSVYCGSFSNDYNVMTNKDLSQYPKYAVTGNGTAILSNRISYYYDLHGPSLTVDTACSSSLVCFHLGNKSIQEGESDLSIVAGSALHFDPSIFITMTDFGMLSSDGRCRTFDAHGSGYVRGEGIAAVILKRKSQAESAGDPIRSVIRATGSNHDGLKDGLMLPNGRAQAQLLRQTYKKAGLSTEDTDYFEAHGTGTKAGDPREAKAIGEVFATGRDRPLLVGSIKSNLGHLEGASGLAGVIKATMSVSKGKILPNMHFNTPNPEIDFGKLKISVPTEVIDWKGKNGIRRASVNSFGYGGSNAHVILENYRPGVGVVNQKYTQKLPEMVKGRPFLLPLTSHTEKAAKKLTAALSSYVENKPELEISDLAYNLSQRRTMHRYRSFAIGHDRQSIMQDLAAQKPIAKWVRAFDSPPKIGFVFTGQGAQWYAMGRQLIELSPFFRATIERCDEVLHRLPDSPEWTCIDELLRSSEESRLSQSRFSQPICAALQLAIVRLLETWGIEPSAVVGHSSGEIVAAYAAGILSFDNTIICAYYRGLYMSTGLSSTTTSPRGAMMAVGLTENEGRAELNAYEGRIDLAAINSPSSLTFSGDEDAITGLQKVLEARKVFARRLKVEQAFHSHHMTPLAPAFQRALTDTVGFRSRPANVKMYSSVTARDSSARELDASYWAANMTGCVRFSEALTGILLDDEDEQRIDVLVEIGAHPALQGPANQVIKGLKLDVRYITSLTREAPAFESLLATAGQLFALGHPVDLSSVNGIFYPGGDAFTSRTPIGRKLDDLPTYPWDHGSFWAETRLIREHRLRHHRHTLLGAPVPGGLRSHPQWRSYLRQQEIAWLSQHVVDGKIVFPAAAYISMAIEAVASNTPYFKEIRLREVVFKSVLTIPNAEAGTEVLTELRPLTISAKSSSSSWYRFVICSFDENDKPIEHCHGQICVESGNPAMVGRLSESGESFLDLQRASNKSKSRASYYKKLQKLGLDYGEHFQLLSGDIESGPGFSLAPLTLDPANVIEVPADECLLHPTTLDAAFHTVFAAIETTRTGKPSDEAFVPTFMHSMSVSGLLQNDRSSREKQHMWVRSLTSVPGSRVAHSDISIQANLSNDILINMKGVEMTALGNDSKVVGAERSLFFQIRWMPAFDAPVDQISPALSTISDMMDNFAHQFPNSKILHLTPSLSRTREVLHLLGGNQRRHHRFQCITPYSTSKKYPGTEGVLLEDWGRLCQFETPEKDSYDLIVASESFDPSLLQHLKTDGFLVCDNVDFDPQGMVRTFKTGPYSAWRNRAAESLAVKALTVLLSPETSVKTQALVSSIAAAHSGRICTLNINDYVQNPVAIGNIISLISLDEDTFFAPSTNTSNRFRAVQELLHGTNKKVLFVIMGATHESSNPAQALFLGLARSLRSENEDIKIATLDLPQQYDVSEVSKTILGIFDGNFMEDEYALRDGMITIPRLEPNDTLNRKLPHGSRRQPTLEPFNQGRKLALKIGKVGLLDTLMFEDDEDYLDTKLKDDDIEIEVKASALNFRDIAASMGIIDDYRLGDECSGVVIRTGSHVKSSEFQPGDRVLACRPGQGAHKSIVRNPALLCHKIGDMDFVTATCFEGVATTAYYSLIDIARLQPGEYCLIHSAAGGVGQMAVQIAQMVGAKVIATVGSQSKRDFLRQNFSLDDTMIFSSRDLSFVEGVLKVTNGRGCDVALNSLAGPLLHATWGCIAPFGRLIEIGKRDIHENSKLDMEPFRKNVTYASVDLITLYNLNKLLLSRLVHDCFNLIAQGKVRPPGPIIQVSYAETQKGFRLLQMGKQFGKVVLVPGDEDIVPIMPMTYRNNDLFDPSRTYLLVGGLGGLGRSLAQWMYRRGARNLAFLSRSGTQRSDAKATVTWLKDRNVNIQIFPGDAADLMTVENCIQAIGKKLAGIFQAAMVLRDIRFAEMSFEQWETCMSPKVRGTYNLHVATTGLNLEFFVCFSSGAAVIGSIAQANYSAANSYMDALMRHRREMGLAGTTMNGGAVTGIGAVAEDAALERIMERLGYELINEEELFYQIEEAVISQPSSTYTQVHGYDDHQIITGINLQTKDLYWATKPLFRNLYSNLDLGVSLSGPQNAMSLYSSLQKAVDPQERKGLLQAAFVEKVASVLAVPTATIQAGNPLSAYGLDSIVAVEFRKWFSQTLAIEVALFDILGAKSIGALITKVDSEITFTTTEGTTTAPNAAFKGVKKSSETSGTHSQREVSDHFVILQRPNNVPLSTFQSRLWFLHNLLEDQSALNFVTVSRIVGQPRLKLLQEAKAELTRRNEILRTRYRDGEEFSEQIVMEDVAAQIASVDISSDSSPEAALDHFIRAVKAKPLDIEQGELTKWFLVKLAQGRYAMVLVCHHIALDNGSTKSFMDQYKALYDALHDQKSLATIKAPKVSYLDFSVWQQHTLQSPRMKDGMRWWRDKLQDLDRPSSLLPFAKAHRPLRRGTARAILRQTLGLPLLKRLKRVCAQSNVTPFQFILTAFRAFIHRYTWEDDLTILMIDGNRPHPDLDDVLGFFVNMVPLRCQNQCNTSFDILMKDIKEITLEALAHSYVSFDKIVEIAKMERNSNHFPIGQIAFNYQMYGKPPKYTTADFTIEDVVTEDIPTACEMQLEALEDPETGIRFRFEYDSLLYGNDDMERFFDNLMTFVGSVVKDHLQPIEEIEMCGPREIAHLREKCWADKFQSNQWGEQTICDRIGEHASSLPESTAVLTSSGERVAYRDLYHRAEKIACLLQASGVVSGQCIGILCYPGVDMIAAMIAVVLSRCGYLPVDPKFATGRISHILQDSSTSVVLIGENMQVLRDELTSSMEDSPLLLSISSSTSTAGKVLTVDPASAQDPFYTIYTSGSTGKPKGVVLTHANTQAMLSSLSQAHRFSSGDVFLCHSSMSFDLSVVQIWGALTIGATIALATQETRNDPFQLARFMRDAMVTVTYFPATQFALVLEHNSGDLRECVGWRLALFAGEYLPVRLVKSIYDLETPVTVYNQWGPTETTAQTTCHRALYPGPTDINLPIGLPLPNCSHYVVDRRLRPVPASVTGELCIGGAQIGSGYLNRPEATKEVFVDNHFAPEAFRARGWNTLYKTGDLGHFLPDGQIDFKGRISGDKQIKLRGQRIDLAEIENEIHLGVQQNESQKLINVVVLPRILVEDGSQLTDNRSLIAFLVPSKACTRSEQQILVNAIHKAIRLTLNEYMLPSGYQVMNTLSTLASEKVDRQMLLTTDLDLIFPSQTTEFGEDGSKGDQQVLACIIDAFKRVLNLPEDREVTPTENFFDLGGQSILVLRLRAILRQKLGIDIPLPRLFECPTPLGIAKGLLSDSSVDEQEASKVLLGMKTIDWNKEAALLSDARYHPQSEHSPLPRFQITEILVTGVDSFNGIHLLAALLTAFPTAMLHVIGSQVRLIPFDLSSSFEQWKLFSGTVTREALESRIRYVPGTLSLDHFGLDNFAFQHLGGSVQAIYHVGAQVSLLKTYSDLKRINVGSTLDIVELARHGSSRTEIHYLSTWSVPHLQSWPTSSRTKSAIDTTETSPSQYAPGGGEELGYFKSRWVAEMLLAQAADRGFQVSVYRASAVTSTAATSLATPSDNLTRNMVLDMIDLGIIPELGDKTPGFSIDFVPVDYLASVIAQLSSTDAAIATAQKNLKYYHICNPAPLPLAALPSLTPKIRKDRGPGTIVPLSEWVLQVQDRANGKEQAQLEMSVLKQLLDLGHTMFSLDSTVTRKALVEIREAGGSVVECPPVDEVYLRSLITATTD